MNNLSNFHFCDDGSKCCQNQQSTAVSHIHLRKWLWALFQQQLYCPLLDKGKFWRGHQQQGLESNSDCCSWWYLKKFFWQIGLEVAFGFGSDLLFFYDSKSWVATKTWIRAITPAIKACGSEKYLNGALHILLVMSKLTPGLESFVSKFRVTVLSIIKVKTEPVVQKTGPGTKYFCSRHQKHTVRKHKRDAYLICRENVSYSISTLEARQV